MLLQTHSKPHGRESHQTSEGTLILLFSLIHIEVNYLVYMHVYNHDQLLSASIREVSLVDYDEPLSTAQGFQNKWWLNAQP